MVWTVMPKAGTKNEDSSCLFATPLWTLCPRRTPTVITKITRCDSTDFCGIKNRACLPAQLWQPMPTYLSTLSSWAALCLEADTCAHQYGCKQLCWWEDSVWEPKLHLLSKPEWLPFRTYLKQIEELQEGREIRVHKKKKKIHMKMHYGPSLFPLMDLNPQWK